MDTSTDKALFDFKLTLDGIDNPTVDINFTVPDGFTINPQSLSQSLDADIKFNITAGTNSIYYEDIPFSISVDENLQITQPSIIFEEDEFNGNYTSSYDFLDEAVGTENDDISWIDWYDAYAENCNIEIISSLGGHDHVVQMTDNDSPDHYYGRDVFSSLQESGSMEFYWRTTDVTKETRLYMQNSGFGPYLLINEGYIQYYLGTIFYNIKSANSNQWYHIRIDFECGSGKYMGLSADTYYVYIDGVQYGAYNFKSPQTEIETVVCTSGMSDSGYSSFYDAIGYSWQEYFVGENVYETTTSTDTYGSSTQLEKGDILFIEYKTNSMAEVVMKFLNNDVIQATYSVNPRGNLYPGIQYQQIIINNTFSFDELEFSKYKSNNFIVNYISIIDAGITASQYFNPLNFTNNGNVPEFVSFDFSGVPFDNIDHSLYPGELFLETQIATILPNTNRISEFNITLPNDSISNLFWRGITYSRSGTNDIYNIYVDNIDFEGIHIVSPKNITHTIMGNSITSGKNEMYLEIIPEEPLVWNAYSLNGNSNISFSGNNTNISLPESNGIHTIQVFGNNSVGTMFESEVKNFTIVYPISMWNIPNGTTLYDTNNKVDVNITSLGCTGFSYLLDGRFTDSFEGYNTTIEHVPFGHRKIIVYGDDCYGEEWSSGIVEFDVALARHNASQPDGFTFTNGTLLTPYGDLRSIDGNYSKLRYDDSGISGSLTLTPNGDGSPLQWGKYPSTNHWENIDEDPDNDDGLSSYINWMFSI
jgi:hypothetical protein